MRALLLLLVTCSAMGQAFTLTDPAFSAAVNARSDSSPTYIVSEDWEGTQTGWSKQNDATKTDFDYTAAAIEGSQSLRAEGDDDSTLPPYAYRTTPFSDIDDCYAFFILKATTGPTSDDFSRELMWLVDFPANQHLLALELYRFSSSSYRLRVWSGTTGHATTAAGFTLGSTVAVWVRYQKGTGANARADVWWADASNLNSLTKPADGSNNHAHRDDGNYTTSVENIQLGAILRSSHGTVAVYDRVRVDDVAIGSNPP
jgi:hypothetical protein